MIESLPLLEKTKWGELRELTSNFLLHLLRVDGVTAAQNNELIQFLSSIRIGGTACIQIWEQDLITNQQLYSSIFSAKRGELQQVHGRKCVVSKIDRLTAQAFLSENHSNGGVKSSIYLGLLHADELLAIAAFSKPMKMSKDYTYDYFSGELVKFCTKQQYRVYGGLDKIIKHYVRNYPVNDVMTYADINFGDGEVYRKLGFNSVGYTPPLAFEFIDGEKAVVKNPFVDKPYFYNSGNEKFVRIVTNKIDHEPGV